VIEPGEPFVDIRAPVAVWEEAGRRWLFPEGALAWMYGSGGTRADGPAFREIAEFETALGPDLLEAEEHGPGVLSLGALFRQRGRPQFASDLHARLAQALAPLALALAALPFVLKTDRSRVLPGTILAILVIAGFEIVWRAMTGLASAGYMPAIVGGWFAPIAFAAAGAWHLARTET
jgi:hypothetical protein